MDHVTFVSFAGTVGGSDNSIFRRQEWLHQTAHRYGGITRSIEWHREHLLQTTFYRQNQAILDQPRGCGYWAWKPWVILETLKQVPNGDYVLYHDVGKPFRDGDQARGGDVNHGNVIEHSPASIIRWAEQHDGIFPGVNTPHYGPASMWTKRDCFVGMDCDSEKYWSKPLVQAGYNAWKNTPRVREFLTTWLAYCTDATIVSDAPGQLGKPDFADFREHRHDQSILSNLVRKWDLAAFGSITESRAYVRNFNYLARRTALDQRRYKGASTLTEMVRNMGGSRNLPISASTWVDLYVATRDRADVRVLWLRSGNRSEETMLRTFFGEDSIEVADWSEVENHRSHYPAMQHTSRPPHEQYDFAFAIGFNNQVALRQAIKTHLTDLKPLGIFIAGLDHSQIGANDQTFARFIEMMAQTRRVRPAQGSGHTDPLNLVIGTNSNPIPMKQRDGLPIVAVIQRGFN